MLITRPGRSAQNSLLNTCMYRANTTRSMRCRAISSRSASSCCALVSAPTGRCTILDPVLRRDVLAVGVVGDHDRDQDR